VTLLEVGREGCHVTCRCWESHVSAGLFVSRERYYDVHSHVSATKWRGLATLVVLSQGLSEFSTHSHIHQRLARL
jgi:hypothetical protein